MLHALKKQSVGRFNTYTDPARLGMILALFLSGCGANQSEFSKAFFKNYNNCDTKIYRSDGSVDYVCRGSDHDLKRGR